MADPFSSLSSHIRASQVTRAAVRDRASRTVQRLSPKRLTQDATDAANDLVRETGAQIRSHPFTAAGAVLGLAALIFHKPLGRLTNRLLDRLLPPDDNDLTDAVEPDRDSDGSAFIADSAADTDSPSPTEHDHDRTLD
jgi:hypothetical protein